MNLDEAIEAIGSLTTTPGQIWPRTPLPVGPISQPPIQVTPDMIKRARRIVAKSPSGAAGYRIKIHLLASQKELDDADAERFPTLAAVGLETKSEMQKEREDRGSDKAIVVHIGLGAFKDPSLADVQWVKVGDVIRILRYTGHQFEDPPGSGMRYGLINDEDVLGVYDENVLEEVTNG
jgi:co-chaperonin GroES (HSP10)